MSKKPKTHPRETQHDRDMGTFDQLPQKTKDLMKLKEHHEKTTGHEKSAVTQHIEDTAASHDQK